MKLVKITGSKAIYYTKSGEITTEAITPEAFQVLKYYKKIPANDFIA